MLTPVWYLRIIFYPRGTAMGSKNQPKKCQAPIYPEDPFSVGAPIPKYGQIRPKVNFWQDGRRDSIF